MNKIRTLSKYLIPAAMLAVPALVFAQIPNPTITLTGSPITLTEIENLVAGIARFLIVISIIVAVIFIVWGGLRWIMARDNAEQAKAARATIINGILGALVILAVGVILQTLAGLVARTFFGTYGS